MAEKTIIQKLLTIQEELKAPKSNYNKFGKYNYRSNEDILTAAKPLNAREGLLLTLTDEPVLIGDWHYIKATATLTDGEKDITVSAYARESQVKKGMDDSQITGTASSYARKYALNGLYLIDDTKDADTDEHRQQTQNAPQQSQPQGPQPPTSEQVGRIKVLVGEVAKLNNIEPSRVIQQLNNAFNIKLDINNVTAQLNNAQASDIINQLIKWEKLAKPSDNEMELVLPADIEHEDAGDRI